MQHPVMRPVRYGQLMKVLVCCGFHPSLCTDLRKCRQDSVFHGVGIIVFIKDVHILEVYHR